MARLMSDVCARSACATSPTTNDQTGNFRRVCYFHMDNKTRIKLCQIDGQLCTHLILAFAQIGTTGTLLVAHNDDLVYLNEVKEFKRLHPRVKVMISILNGYQNIISSQESRQKFANSAIEYLQKYQLDGIDLNWQFTNFPSSLLGTKGCERSGLTKILKALRSAIVENFYDRQLVEQHGLKLSLYTSARVPYSSAVEPHLLTVAVAGQESVLRANYELHHLANLCDWLNVMSFDYFLFKAYAPFTGPNSPLYPIVDHYVPILSKLSFSWTVGRLLEEGLPRDKIVMGIPTYARAYKLIFKQTTPTSFALSVGSRGGQLDDYLSYREVCEILEREDTRVEFDVRARVPYLLTDNGYTWISYENIQSVREKVNYTLQQNLGGYMTWNLNCDKFPLVKAAISLNRPPSSSDTLAESAASNGMGVVAGAAGADSGQGTNTSKSTKTSTTTFPLHRAMFNEIISYLSGPSSI